MKAKIDTEIMNMTEKRTHLILKILGQLYRGQIGTLHFKNGVIYLIGYYTDYNNNEKKKLIMFTNYEDLKTELLKNIHDISEDFNEENMSILEFLMDRMNNDWNTNQSRKAILKDIEDDIQEIKNRCANYLLIMQIEESEK